MGCARSSTPPWRSRGRRRARASRRGRDALGDVTLTFASSSSSSSPRMTTPSRSHSNSLAIAAPFGLAQRWSQPSFPEPFADLSNLGGMAQTRARIQLCGRLVVRLGGRRVEDALPGANGRLLFAYLVLNRLRRMDRDELLTAVYGEDAPPDHHPRLSVLLSKLRHAVGPELLRRTIGDRARAAAGRLRRRRGGVRGSAPRAVPRRQRRVGGGLGPVRRRLSRGQPSPAPGSTTARGWTSGGGASTTFGCTGSSASRRRGSASADRRCRRPRNAGAGSSSWRRTARPATGS